MKPVNSGIEDAVIIEEDGVPVSQPDSMFHGVSTADSFSLDSYPDIYTTVAAGLAHKAMYAPLGEFSTCLELPIEFGIRVCLAISGVLHESWFGSWMEGKCRAINATSYMAYIEFPGDNTESQRRLISEFDWEVFKREVRSRQIDINLID